MLQVNVSLSEEEQKMSQNSNENSNGLKMAGIPDLVTAAMDDVEKSYSETFSDLESTLFTPNSSEAQDDFAVMNTSVLSDAFEDFVIANSTENDFHQFQQLVHNSSEDNNEDVSLSGYLKNINEDISDTLFEEDSMEPVIQASSWNAVYSVPSNQIPSPMSDKATPEYFANNFGKSPTKKILHRKLDQSGERCGNPTTTSTCPPLVLEPSPVPTESSTSISIVCGNHQQVTPTTNQTFNSSATVEAEMERRRQKALRKILIHLVRSRSEAAPIVIAGSTGFVLVAMGFVILMMVI